MDWRAISSNKAVPWSYKILDEFRQKLHWSRLSYNSSLPWSEELIERYENEWDWVALSGAEYLPWTSELIKKYYIKIEITEFEVYEKFYEIFAKSAF
mgnify:CR=1 FL=1